jgi:NhaP-type Na+/H+ or K+/H+ antiporter
LDYYILDLLVIGILLLFVTLGSGWMAHLPFSYAQLYLLVGIGLGPYGFGLIKVQPDAHFLERLTELVVIISVFSCGLKMNRPLKLWSWNITARLIGFLMPISIVAIALMSHWLLGLSWGAAILLGAILAPTDPVLASDVQLESVTDRTELRFGLTSEGGLNDALAFPFVYFGIYLLKNDNWQQWFRDWVAVDLLWAIAAGIVMGIVVAKAIVWLERRLQAIRPADDLVEDFLALSTILIAYSLTEVVNGYGFLAVFVAGVTVQANYYSEQEKRMDQLEFTERIEKLLELATILLLGSILRAEPMLRYLGDATLLGVLLLFVIRPLGTWVSTAGSNLRPATRWLMGWFGIRGVGSLYYLTYSLTEGLEGGVMEELTWIVFLIVIASVLLHGVSSTPLMDWYTGTLKPKQQNDSDL